MPRPFLAILYLLFCLWLFTGIARIADVFMEAIEVITSATKRVEVYDKKGD